jgi:hypothetical protein
MRLLICGNNFYGWLKDDSMDDGWFMMDEGWFGMDG